MKRLLIIMSAISFMFQDSAVGNWKLTGLTVDYYDIARPHPDNPDGVAFTLKDSYGYGIAVDVATVPSDLYSTIHLEVHGVMRLSCLQGLT